MNATKLTSSRAASLPITLAKFAKGSANAEPHSAEQIRDAAVQNLPIRAVVRRKSTAKSKVAFQIIKAYREHGDAGVTALFKKHPKMMKVAANMSSTEFQRETAKHEKLSEKNFIARGALETSVSHALTNAIKEKVVAKATDRMDAMEWGLNTALGNMDRVKERPEFRGMSDADIRRKLKKGLAGIKRYREHFEKRWHWEPNNFPAASTRAARGLGFTDRPGTLGNSARYPDEPSSAPTIKKGILAEAKKARALNTLWAISEAVASSTGGLAFAVAPPVAALVVGIVFGAFVSQGLTEAVEDKERFFEYGNGLLQ